MQRLDTMILASQAELAADLTEGILTSARLVLNQQLQLAANQMMRVGGRLYRAWADRCRFVVQGLRGQTRPRFGKFAPAAWCMTRQERQIYFDNAQFRSCRGAGLLYPAPQDARPDAEARDGFLTPKLRTTSEPWDRG